MDSKAKHDEDRCPFTKLELETFEMFAKVLEVEGLQVAVDALVGSTCEYCVELEMGSSQRGRYEVKHVLAVALAAVQRLVALDSAKRGLRCDS